MKLADHVGVGVRSGRSSDDVVGAFDVGDPVAHGFVQGVFEGSWFPRKLGELLLRAASCGIR